MASSAYQACLIAPVFTILSRRTDDPLEHDTLVTEMNTLTQDQWLQVIAIVGPTLISGTVMIGGATWYLASRIERLRLVVNQLGDLALRVADIASRLSAVEARVTSLENIRRIQPRG